MKKHESDLIEKLKDSEYLKLYIKEALDNYDKDKDIYLLLYCMKPAISAQKHKSPKTKKLKK